MYIPRTLDDLNALVAERVEENQTLEFKRALPESGKNHDIAKDAAAMGNSGGGVIIYGVAEDAHRCAHQLMPFDPSGAVERIVLVVGTSVDDPLVLDEVFLIPVSQDVACVVAVVPDSPRRPHFHEGAAYGRSAAGNYSLSRHRIGELFAASEGFATEFSLRTGAPARVKATYETRQHTSASVRDLSITDHFLIIQNDGEDDALNVDWEWVADTAPNIRVMSSHFPMTALLGSALVQLQFFIEWGETLPLFVKTSWQDVAGNRHEAVWPIG